MKKFSWIVLVLCFLVLMIVTACGGGSDSNASDDPQSEESADGDDNGTSEEDDGDSNASNEESHDSEADYVWDSSDVIPIDLNGNSISVDSANATVDGSIVTITAAGTYSLSGDLYDGQVIVDTEDEEIVRLILNGIQMESSTSAPVFIKNAAKAMLVLAENTENSITDAATYLFEDSEEDEPNAAVFSKSDLTIFGEGSLTVTGNYNDGIAGKDGLIITSGNISVNAVDDGIRGKDYLIVKDGSLTVDAQGDGLKSDNEEDAGRGYILIEYGEIDISSQADAISAATDITIMDGDFNITTGGGGNGSIDLETSSAKGLKAAVSVIISGGSFTISSADDAIHSNDSVEIDDGIFDISSADDGVHADALLDINGGDIRITQSFEGLESAVVTINGGEISIVASDDGINVAGGNDGSATGRPGEGGFDGSGDQFLYINGGYIVIDSTGDGLDSNGAIEMNGGDVIVNGPTSSGNGALDYQQFTMNGGFIVAAGSSGMAQTPGSNSSSQNALLLNFDTSLTADTIVYIETGDGSEILTFAPAKSYQSIAFSSPQLITGTTFTVYTGGSSSGTGYDGLYQDGTYTPGNLYTTFTVSGTVTTIGNTGGGGRP